MVAVVTRALELSKQDFSITEGIRHIDRQKELVKTGKSTTLNSRHLTGHAVDVVPYPVSWDWEYFHPIAEAMEKAAKELKVNIVWGGDWVNFPDGPHFQLDWKAYPSG
tara:strand:+ start:27465 stop:27788 length:324 start_codon:yes stop_codon:yes gene_type:complete